MERKIKRTLKDATTNHPQNWKIEVGAAHHVQQTCEICDKVLQHEGSLVTHRRRIHGIYTAVFLRVVDSTCPFCLRDFFTLARVRKHFRSVTKCHNLLLQLPEMDLDDLERVKEEDAQVRASNKNLGGFDEHKALRTYRQLSGPRPHELYM